MKVANNNKPNIKLPIYLDYQATTPMDPRVLEKMLPYFTEKFGNPHSRSHAYGWEAEAGVEKARKQVADLIGANDKEIIFTSGATESNNMALKGIAHFYRNKKDHIVTVVTEHKCVLDACRHLEQEGFKVTYLPVEKNGLLDLEILKNAITDKTAIVSVMAINNEIGVIQDLKAIGKICREKGAFFHTDAAQGTFGKNPLECRGNEYRFDEHLNASSIYGPKASARFMLAAGGRVCRMEPLINGGGQERGMRSGTLPTPLIVGLGEAAAIAQKEMPEEYARIKKLSDRFYNAVARDVFPMYF